MTGANGYPYSTLSQILLKGVKMKKLLMAGLTVLLLARVVYADQLQCNPKETAEKVAAMLKPGLLLIDYCYLCDDSMRLVRIEQASAVADCQYEVKVVGTQLASTRESFQQGKGVEHTSWEFDSRPFSKQIDLAYAYVEVAPNRFHWLGGVLGLKASVNVATLKLPAQVSEKVGQRDLFKVEQGFRPMPEQPAASWVRAVWEYYYQGQGGGPVLVELVPCLEVDEKAGSPTRYECLQPAAGTLGVGAKVSAWTSWLVPENDQIDSIMVQYLHNGVVRTTRDLKLSGKGWRYRTYTSAVLNKAGRWEIVVLNGTQELGRVGLEVR